LGSCEGRPNKGGSRVMSNLELIITENYKDIINIFLPKIISDRDLFDLIKGVKERDILVYERLIESIKYLEKEKF